MIQIFSAGRTGRDTSKVVQEVLADLKIWNRVTKKNENSTWAGLKLMRRYLELKIENWKFHLSKSKVDEVVSHSSVGEDDTLEEVGKPIRQGATFQSRKSWDLKKSIWWRHLVRISVRTESPMSWLTTWAFSIPSLVQRASAFKQKHLNLLI